MKKDLELAKAYLYQNKLEETPEEQFNNLKTRLKVFDDVTTIAKAREIAKDLFHIENDINYIKIENAICVIVQDAKLFRVCLENDKEFICYNIISKTEK